MFRILPLCDKRRHQDVFFGGQYRKQPEFLKNETYPDGMELGKPALTELKYVFIVIQHFSGRRDIKTGEQIQKR